MATPSFVTQVSKDTQQQLEVAVRNRRESVSQTRARRESLSKVKVPEEPDPEEVKNRALLVEKRARGSSISIHEQKPKAPYRDDHLLPPLPKEGRYAHKKHGKKCLVLDLDETLVHSSFKPVEKYDFVIPVEIEGTVYQVYVAKRPGVDEFMKKVGELFEVVIFTASLSVYATPLLDKLDIHKVIDWRLFRESCTYVQGTYVKDMCRMGRDMKRILIIDNSPHAFAFNPENAIPCESWFDDYEDVELYDLIPILTGLADESVEDIAAELELLQINGVAAVEQGFGDSDSGSEEYSEEESQ
jgi:RNA polymerase II subunit A small phosphatase-like protein